jgi:uncharacterized membrane protein
MIALIQILVVVSYSVLTYGICRLDDKKEAMIGLWKVFMIITSIASWIILILMLTGVIKRIQF